MSGKSSAEKNKKNKIIQKNKNIFKGETVGQNFHVVPDVARVKLTYRQRVTMGGSAGVQIQKFRGNDLYDPDISGTGAQPYGFDQWMNLYERFRVLGSSIDVWFCSVGTSAGTQSFEAIVVPTATGVSFSLMEDAAAAPYALWKVNQGLSNPAMHIVSQMQTHKIEGIPLSKVRDEDTYSGTASTSASSGFDWQILTQSIDRLSSLSCFAYVNITYDVELFSRVNLTLS